MMYWYNQSFKKKKATDGDKKTLTKIHANLLSADEAKHELDEWYSK